MFGRLFSALLLCAGLVVVSAKAEAAAAIAYRVTPEVADGQLRDLRMEVSFRADARGVTRVALPDSWSGAQALYRAVRDVEADGARVRMDGPAKVVLTSAPWARVTLRYKVRQDFEGELSVREGSPFRPVTRPKWFTSVGWALFPEIEGRAQEPVTFAWGPTPEGWTVASDLDHATNGPRRVDDLLDSVLTGGEGLKVVERESAGGRIRFAVQGSWKFTDAQLADLQGRIAESSAEFWKDRGGEFFVAVTPLAAPRGGMVQYGVGLGDAFSLWASSDVDTASLRHILAHEYQHAWFPNRVGGVRAGPDEPLDYWLSEGFTDFYTLRILLRSGVWSLEEFVADYNRILKAYAASAVREAPNRLIAANFWNDREVADLPYQRGLLLASVWDARLRAASGGAADLDDIVLAMKARADSGQADRGAVDNLRVAYRSLGGGDLDADFRRYVDGGQRVFLPADLFGDCATVRTWEVPTFERGFDTAATSRRNGVVDGVDPDGPAYAAGLRSGMRILGREGGDNADSRVDLVYRVEDRGVVKLIRYKPVGRTLTAYQDVVLNPGLDPQKRAECARSMAGL